MNIFVMCHVVAVATISGFTDPLIKFHRIKYNHDIISPFNTRRRRVSSSNICSSYLNPLDHHHRHRRRQSKRNTMKSNIITLHSSITNNNNEYEEYEYKEEKIEIKEMKQNLAKEFLSIALPALIQLAAEPLAGLVDTAYLGRLGPEVLGGAGVAISAQYAVSKLYNDPLLRTSISLVASQDGRSRRMKTTTTTTTEAATAEEEEEVLDDQSSIQQKQQQQQEEEEKNAAELSVAVSSALLLALSVGLIQLILYYTLANAIISTMGVTSISPMFYSAVSYLRIRALGTPAATLWLVSNGIFRGLGDTKTPLIYSLFFTGLNAILDPIFIFTFHYGASGAAAGTALAQYIALIPLLLALHHKIPGGVNLFGRMKELGRTMVEYLRAGAFVLLRTLGKVLAYSICARQAAILGPVAAAAYNLTFQLGFATTQICEAVAVAVQTLLAREIAETTTTSSNDNNQNNKVHHRRSQASIQFLIHGSILAGGIVATILSVVTYIQRYSILQGLTTNVPVREMAASIFPIVLITQVLKGLAYPVNGIIMGGLDWKFTMIAMWIANIVCISILHQWNSLSSTTIVSLERIWIALAAFMGTQVITGILRFQSKTGIWKVLTKKQKQKQKRDQSAT